jgi:hypothetical protein
VSNSVKCAEVLLGQCPISLIFTMISREELRIFGSCRMNDCGNLQLVNPLVTTGRKCNNGGSTFVGCSGVAQGGVTYESKME